MSRQLIAVCEQRGHRVCGYGRGDIDLDDVASVVDRVRDADVFINNANYRFSQAEILAALFEQWRHDPSKHIVNISSRAGQPNISRGYLYAAQKAALDHLANNLVFNSDKTCRITTVALGLVRDGNPHAISYREAAESVIDLIEVPEHVEITHLAVQHRANYQWVQAEKLKKH